MIDINKLENLPYKESMVPDNKGYWYTSSQGVYRKIDGKFPWTHVQRTLAKFKGKNVDKAFSYYCDIVDKCQQYMFWDELDDPIKYRYRWDKEYRWGYYYIDNQKRIQYKKPKKGITTYVIHSHDIEWEEVEITVRNEEQERWWKQDAYYQDTERRISKGEIFSFNKKNDAYHKCYAEQLSKKRKDDRIAKIESDKKAYSFLTLEEEFAIKDRENDIIIRDSHGFDEDSFTNNNNRLK